MAKTYFINDKKEFNLIDINKFIMSIFVIMLHTFFYNDINNIYISSLIKTLLCCAVPYFFVAAGFFLFKSNTTLDITTNKIVTYRKRIISLYSYWFIIYLPISLFYSNDYSLHNIATFIRFFFFNGFGHLWFLWGLILSTIIIQYLLKIQISTRKILLFGIALFIFNRLYSHYGSLEYTSGPLYYLSYLYKNRITNIYGITNSVLYVSIGLFIAKNGILKSNIILIILFILGLSIAYLEEHKGVSIGQPLMAYSFFSISTKIRINSTNKIYKTLRYYSTLIYFSHMFIQMILQKVYHIHYGCRLFVLTLSFTLITSLCIYYLKDKKYFLFLRKLA